MDHDQNWCFIDQERRLCTNSALVKPSVTHPRHASVSLFFACELLSLSIYVCIYIYPYEDFFDWFNVKSRLTSAEDKQILRDVCMYVSLSVVVFFSYILPYSHTCYIWKKSFSFLSSDVSLHASLFLLFFVGVILLTVYLYFSHIPLLCEVFPHRLQQWPSKVLTIQGLEMSSERLEPMGRSTCCQNIREVRCNPDVVLGLA